LTSMSANGRPLVHIVFNCVCTSLSCRKLSDKIDMDIFPQHSVIPYEMKNSQPKIAIALVTAAGASGHPPHDTTRNVLRSCVFSNGL